MGPVSIDKMECADEGSLQSELPVAETVNLSSRPRTCPTPRVDNFPSKHCNWPDRVVQLLPQPLRPSQRASNLEHTLLELRREIDF